MFWCGQDHTEGEIPSKSRLLSVGKLLEPHKGSPTCKRKCFADFDKPQDIASFRFLKLYLLMVIMWTKIHLQVCNLYRDNDKAFFSQCGLLFLWSSSPQNEIDAIIDSLFVCFLRRIFEVFMLLIFVHRQFM